MAFRMYKLLVWLHEQQPLRRNPADWVDYKLVMLPPDKN